MEIGKPRRVYTVEPIKKPIPRKEPERPPERKPAEPAKR
jgi:hypothetical protein